MENTGVEEWLRDGGSASADAVEYITSKKLPQFFEHLVADALKHRPEGRRSVLRRMRFAAGPKYSRSQGTLHKHRGKHTIPDTPFEVGEMIDVKSTWFGSRPIAATHEGVDTSTGEKIAIKIIGKSKITKHNHQHVFVQNLRKMRHLRHPNILKLKQIVLSFGRVYLILERAPGRLDRLLRERPGGRMAEEEAVKIFQQLTLAVRYIHNQGHVHGAISIKSVLLDEDGNVKLTNFNSQALGLRGRGSLFYHAPEDFDESAEEMTQAADIWVLGVILFTMLVGSVPFADSRPTAMLNKIERGEWRHATRHLSQQAKDLLGGIFVQPEKRATIADIAAHPWVKLSTEALLDDDEVCQKMVSAAMLNSVFIPNLDPSRPSSDLALSPSHPVRRLTGEFCVSPSQHCRQTSEFALSPSHPSRRPTASMRERSVTSMSQTMPAVEALNLDLDAELGVDAHYVEDSEESSTTSDDDDDSPRKVGMKPSSARLMSRPSVVEEGSVEEEINKAEAARSDTIDLSNFALGFKPDGYLSRLPNLADHLTDLDLSSNEIEDVPEEIFTLTKLVSLSLKENHIHTIPHDFSSLSLLTHLFLDDNSLTEIPRGIGSLKHLVELGLDWNQLTALPAEVAALPALHTLHLVNNPLHKETAFPSSFPPGKTLTLRLHNAPWVVSQADRLPSNVEVQWTKLYPDLVFDNFLYLGPLQTAQDPHLLKDDLGITFVASIGRELTVSLTSEFRHLRLNVDDVPGTDLTSELDKVHAFFDEAKAAGVNCLVHCFKGQSRSATMAITYVMRKLRVGRDQAIDIVKMGRPCINPNPGFMEQMLVYEKVLDL